MTVFVVLYVFGAYDGAGYEPGDVHVFASREAAEAWIDTHPVTYESHWYEVFEVPVE